jgi:uncharacterized membrane-anchored protein
MTKQSWDPHLMHGSDARLVAAVIVGATLIFVAMIVGLVIVAPWQSPEEKACVAGYQSERARDRGVPQATTREYCRALYG